MAGFALLGGVFLAILSAFYLKQIPGRGDIDSLATNLTAEFGPMFEPGCPLDIKLVPPARKGERMGLQVRCVLRAKVPVLGPDPHRELLRQIGQHALSHPSWVGRVAFASVQNGGQPELVERVLPAPVERFPAEPQRASRLPAKG